MFCVFHALLCKVCVYFTFASYMSLTVCAGFDVFMCRKKNENEPGIKRATSITIGKPDVPVGRHDHFALCVSRSDHPSGGTSPKSRTRLSLPLQTEGVNRLR